MIRLSTSVQFASLFALALSACLSMDADDFADSEESPQTAELQSELATSGRFLHADPSGGRGYDRMTLSAPKACATVKSVNIVWYKRRYGTVTRLEVPRFGCNPVRERCAVRTQWRHDPAGSLDYKLAIEWNEPSRCSL